MDYLHSLFEHFMSDPYYQRMLLGILLAGSACALLSPLLIVRRMVVTSIGIGGASFAGVMIGLICFPAAQLFSWPILSIAGLLSFIAALVFFFARGNLDALFGIIFMMGVWLPAIRDVQIPGFFLFLAGTPHISTTLDLSILGTLLFLVVLWMGLSKRSLQAVCVDAGYARVMGMRVALHDGLLIVVVTATILVSIYSAGFLFTMTCLILPGCLARTLTFRFDWMLGVSVLFCILTSVISMILFYEGVDLPLSVLLGLMQLPILILTKLIRNWIGNQQSLLYY